jgi:hypothetical protein
MILSYPAEDSFLLLTIAKSAGQIGKLFHIVLMKLALLHILNLFNSHRRSQVKRRLSAVSIYTEKSLDKN